MNRKEARKLIDNENDESSMMIVVIFSSDARTVLVWHVTRIICDKRKNSPWDGDGFLNSMQLFCL